MSRTTCHNHGTVCYQFIAGGHEYSGWGSAGFGTRDCDDLKVGDEILVYYLPSDPTLSRPGSIRERWANELISIFLAVALVPTAIVWAVWRQLPDRYRASSR